MTTRLAASFAAAAFICACSGPKDASTAGGASPSPAAASTAAAVPAGAANVPVALAGTPGGIPLDAAQRAELDAAVAKARPAERARLRYALATGDDGKRHLVVYDGEGLGVSGRYPGRPHEYVIFKILNAAKGERYDPQQNALVAPIPPPAPRESPITR